MKLNRSKLFAVVAIVFALIAQHRVQAQQKISNLNRDRAEEMLRMIRDDVKKNYYDSSYHGIDLDARFKTYDDRIKQSQYLGDAFTYIASYLSALKDSHTFFVPPSRSYRFDYGLRFQIIGEQAYVTEIRPGSDAASKVHLGDEILSINGYNVNRGDFHDLTYYLYQLLPQGGLSMVLRDPSGGERKELVNTKFEQGQRTIDLTGSGGAIDIWNLIRQQENAEHLLRERWVEQDDVMVWKMPEFFMQESQVDDMFGKARKHKALILDLRGNPGGSVDTLERVVGNVMDHNVTIATRVARKAEKPQLAKTRGKDIFEGKLIVLIDSRSASAAELVARTVQLEHRGTVVGDQSAGAVMEARFYPEHIGLDTQVFYGASITDANLIMSDGKSLEGVGVIPDVIVLPTAADLAAGRDPALSKAAELAGIKLDPVAAGKLFPFEWAPLEAE
ncbi:MAG TPA: S41 family peptidase [Candidatus Acidoferrales bacterium]|nr:S41 family peptidase [Candidatus Acidoferrales bacterium]